MSSALSTLQAHFERRQKSNAAYSYGALARQLGCSVSYVSRIMGGQRKLPLGKCASWARALDMDELGTMELRAALAQDRLGQEAAESLAAENRIPPAKPSVPLELSGQEHRFLLEKWYYLAILDLSTCNGFVAEAGWLANRLGLPVEEATEALRRLIDSECLILKEGKWQKNQDKIRFPDGRDKFLHNRYQKENLRRAFEELRNTDDASIASRLVLGGTVATNEENMKRARAILNRAMMEALQVLCEGEADRVMQFSLALMPVSKKD